MGICKLSENGCFAVDGEPIYAPSTINVKNNSVLSSDSKMAESGVQYLTWIRRKRRIIKITYDFISAEEVAVLNELMQGKEFDFTFYDNGIQTIRAFAKSDTYNPHRLNVYPEFGGLYKNYTIDIEEK